MDPAFMLSRFQIVVCEYEPGDHGEVVRRLDQLATETHWEVEVSPPPSLDERQGPVTGRLGLTLQQLGVLPGSTVHFRRPARGG